MSKAKKPISKEKMSLAQLKKNILEANEKCILDSEIELTDAELVEFINLEDEKLFLQAKIDLIDHRLLKFIIDALIQAKIDLVKEYQK